MTKQMQQTKRNRERMFKLFDRGLGVPVVIFLALWLVVGTVLTLVATFAGSVLTFGLMGWPVGLLGFGLTFGGAWVIFTLFAKGGDRLKTWAANAERDPEGETRRQAVADEYWKSITESTKAKQAARR